MCHFESNGWVPSCKHDNKELREQQQDPSEEIHPALQQRTWALQICSEHPQQNIVRRLDQASPWQTKLSLEEPETEVPRLQVSQKQNSLKLSSWVAQTVEELLGLELQLIEFLETR